MCPASDHVVLIIFSNLVKTGFSGVRLKQHSVSLNLSSYFTSFSQIFHLPTYAGSHCQNPQIRTRLLLDRQSLISTCGLFKDETREARGRIIANSYYISNRLNISMTMTTLARISEEEYSINKRRTDSPCYRHFLFLFS